MRSVVEQRTDDDSDSSARPESPAGPPWLRRHVRLLVMLDALAMTGSTFLAKVLSFGTDNEILHVRGFQIPYLALTLVTVPAWLAVLGMSSAYAIGPFGASHGEVRRVVSAAAHFLALIAVAYYIVHLDRLGRGFLIVIIPLAMAFTVTGRFAARTWLRLQRKQGRAMRRAVIVGSRRQVRLLATHLLAHPGAGIAPVGALLPGASPVLPIGDHTDLPVVGTQHDVPGALAQAHADVVLITTSLPPGELRKLTWQLEGSGVDVLVAPTVGRLRWPHLGVRPVAGLPLLYVDRADLGASAPG